jgi:hypothetical protein
MGGTGSGASEILDAKTSIVDLAAEMENDRRESVRIMACHLNVHTTLLKALGLSKKSTM